MHFTTPPSIEDIRFIAETIQENLPQELFELVEDLTIRVEDIAEDALAEEMELNDPYELVASFQSGNQISPGIQRKLAEGEEVLILYRRALLDLWAETGEDLNVLIRQVMIEELGQNFDFSDAEIDDMARRSR